MTNQTPTLPPKQAPRPKRPRISRKERQMTERRLAADKAWERNTPKRRTR